MGTCISKCSFQKTTFVSKEKKQDPKITSMPKPAVAEIPPVSQDKSVLEPPKTPPPDLSSSLSSSFSPSCTTASTASSLSSNSFVSSIKQSIPPQVLSIRDVSRRTPVCKRQRSPSPSLTRQKSLRTTVPRSSSPSSQLRRSPSPSRRVMKVGHCNQEKNSQISSSTRPLSSRRGSGSLCVGRGEMEIRKRPIQPLVEASEGQSSRKTPVMEDLANPLMEMDCFIFI